jgi:CRP-like cAMP-binding protein
MAMDSVKDEDAPAPSENEPTQDEASWAIATAESLQARGDIANAVVWYRRATEYLMLSGDDERALDIARMAASLVSPARPMTAPPGSIAAQKAATASPSPASVIPPRPPSIHPSVPPSTHPSAPPAKSATASPSLFPSAPPVFSGHLADIHDPDFVDDSGANVSGEISLALQRAVAFQPSRAAEAEQIQTRLTSLPLFAGISQEIIRAVARQVSAVRFEQNEPMITPSTAPGETPLLVVVDGRGIIRTMGDERPGTPITAGDYVGELGALYGGSTLLSVTARSQLLAVAIPASLVRWLCREVPEFRSAVEDTAWERAFGAVGRGAPFLRRLSPDQRGVVYARFEPTILNEGEPLLGEGAPPLALWVVAAGEVEIYGGGIEGQSPRRAKAGDVIGLRALTSNEPCGVSARALRNVLAARLGVGSFRSMMEKYPVLGEARNDVGFPGRGVVC